MLLQQLTKKIFLCSPDYIKRNTSSITKQSVKNYYLSDLGNENVCKQEQLVNNQYGKLVEGMRTYMSSVDKQRQGYFAQKRSFIAGLKHLDELIEGKGQYNNNYNLKYSFMFLTQSCLRVVNIIPYRLHRK